MTNTNAIQTKRLITLYVLGFLTVFGYAFARPCIDSIFLEHYSNDDLPAAWLLTSLLSAVVIAIYNRYNQRYAILHLYGATSVICASLLAILLLAYSLGFIPAIFLLYIWKEIYMVVLMETYWSFADIVFSITTAKHNYGWAMAISSLGGVLGNLIVGPFAKQVGTPLALSSLIVFLLMGLGVAYFGRKLADEKPSVKEKNQIGFGIKVLFSSRYLVPLAILACTVQVITALIDYRFNGMLQENYVNTDVRTEVLGFIHAAVNVIGISIQLFMAVILRVFGIGTTFKSIPFLMSLVMLLFVLLPHFAIMVVVKIANKALDYSLFRGVKEILYIPLTREEKTQGKGLIDIFMYRLARGLSSILLMGMIAVGMASYVMELSLAFSLLWLLLAAIIAQRYRSLVKTAEES